MVLYVKAMFITIKRLLERDKPKVCANYDR
jgi:hypothetical protein